MIRIHRARANALPALALACACLVGCATPNLQPFAEQTTRLAEAVSGEQRQIVLKFEQVIELYDEACKKANRASPKRDAQPPLACRQKQQREADAASYAESRRIIDGLLEKAVQYSASVAELANAGETGGQAAQSLLGSVKQFGSLVGVGGTAITGTVAATLEKVATAVTRVQAQGSLADATAAAQEAIATVADGVRDLHAPSDRIAGVLYADEKDVLLTLAGEDVVGLFHDAAAGREAVSQRLRGAELASLGRCGETGAERAKCAELQAAFRNAEDLGKLLDHLRPEYQSYETRRAAALRWRADRKENLAAIAKATGAWKAEHARVAEALKRCGGLGAYRCATIDAASLKMVVDQINEIRSKRE
jgi:hypothetical protein